MGQPGTERGNPDYSCGLPKGSGSRPGTDMIDHLIAEVTDTMTDTGTDSPLICVGPASWWCWSVEDRERFALGCGTGPVGPPKAATVQNYRTKERIERRMI